MCYILGTLCEPKYFIWARAPSGSPVFYSDLLYAIMTIVCYIGNTCKILNPLWATWALLCNMEPRVLLGPSVSFLEL